MKLLLCLGVVGIFLTACTSPLTTTSLPSVQPLYVVYHPALRVFVEDFSQCAGEQPGLGLYLLETTSPVSAKDADLLLWWGNPLEEGIWSSDGCCDESQNLAFATVVSEKSLFVLGEEALVVVTHIARRDVSLSTEEIIDLFSGQISHWSDGTPVQVWSYPAEDIFTQVFLDRMGLVRLAPDAHLAPDPWAMLLSIATDEAALGYLPAAWLSMDESVHSVSLDGELGERLRQPIVAAMSSSIPQEFVEAWLVCVQDAFQSRRSSSSP